MEYPLHFRWTLAGKSLCRVDFDGLSRRMEANRQRRNRDDSGRVRYLTRYDERSIREALRARKFPALVQLPPPSRAATIATCYRDALALRNRSKRRH